MMEGVSWDNGKGFVREHRRDFAFPEGETLIDVAARADELVHMLLPQVLHITDVSSCLSLNQSD